MRKYNMNILEEIQNCPAQWKVLGEVAFIKRREQLPHLLEKRKYLCRNRDEFLNLKNYERTKDLGVDLSDVEFEIELLKTDEINLDYILALIVEKSKNSESKEAMKAEVSRVIRSSIDIRAKEELIIEFINDTDLQN